MMSCQPANERQLVSEEIAVQWRTVMAALCPGVQYGLSSQQNFGENKDLIFVKLTDSALRAIEEFLKNQNKFSQTPTIKFLGSENGELSFPSIHHQGGSTSFSFSMSSTADMEGPGGSFECIQQIGSPRGSLECLGSIPYKIRVHANEDVYEATRTRMTEAEDKYKNKCTREIKPNQTDIGRKVKVKQSAAQARVAPIAPIRREMPSMRDSLLKQPSLATSYHQPSLKPHQNAVPPTVQNNNNNHNGLLSNGLGSNHVSSSKPQLNKPSVPDIARRPLKERLIHLLALKPFRKFELYERLQKEGLREKNGGMSSVLKQIATLKDNCYHLNRAMWNEVHEDWQFYTESEKQMLKRRKPQNLTPPGGSDGGSSSGSGQSPTSTHPGSPPPISSSKRPSYLDGGGDSGAPPNKRQRISHYRKPQPAEQQPYHRAQVQPFEGSNQRRPPTDSRDASNMNPRSRESVSPPMTNGYYGSANGYGNGMLNDKRHLSDDEDGNGGAPVSAPAPTKKRSCDSHNNLSFGVNREKTFVNGRSSSPPANKMATPPQEKDHLQQPQHPTMMNGGPTINGYAPPPSNGRVVHQQHHNNQYLNHQMHPVEERNKYNKVTSSTQNNSRIARVSPDSQTEILPPDLEPPPIKGSNAKVVEDEFPDYKSQYTKITSLEQRRKYKADFNADYNEYRILHGIVEQVSRKFAQLEERLKQKNEGSPEYKDIKNQIIKEYHENKKDLEHQRAKRRFDYLHGKLSHIKGLVFRYDQGVREESQY